jgi:hypothetical protein
MRTRWLPCLALLALTAVPAPRLAAQQKAQAPPTVVLRVRSLDTLFDTARVVAGLFGKEQTVKQLEDLIKSKAGPKGLDAIDGKRPVGLYARVGKDISDLQAVFLIPIASEKDFLELLANLDYKAEKGKDGLYAIKQNILPNDVHLRFAHQYAYLTPLGADALDAAALLEPGKVFLARQSAALTLTVRVDQIPDMAKQFLLEQLRGALGKAIDDKLPGESAAQQAFRSELTNEVLRQIGAALADGVELNAEVDLDAKSQQLRADVTLSAKPGSAFAATIDKLGKSKSLFGSLMRDDAAFNALVHYGLPEKLRGALGGVIAEAAGKALAQTTDPARQKQAKMLLDTLAPTFVAGDLDLGLSLRGPDADKRYTLIAGLKVQDAHKVEAALGELIKDLPAAERDRIKLNVEKAGKANVHSLDLGKSFDAGVKAAFGEGPVYVAFRPDAVFVAVGGDALKAIREAAAAEPTAGAPLRLDLSLARLATVMAKSPAEQALAQKLLASGDDSRVRVAVEGGSELRVRLQMGLSMVRLLSALGRGGKE